MVDEEEVRLAIVSDELNKAYDSFNRRKRTYEGVKEERGLYSTGKPE
jgi:hypothetical protein